jgi:hypothetical protein
MATIVVLGVLGSTASFLVLDAVDGYTDAATRAQLHAELSIAMDHALREVRKIELDSGAVGEVAPNITDLSAESLKWQDSDLDQYELRKSGSELQLNVNGVGLATLMTDVTVLSIKGYDDGGPLPADPDTVVASCSPCLTVRRISVEVTAARGGITESLRFKVFIRSTMSGAPEGS